MRGWLRARLVSISASMSRSPLNGGSNTGSFIDPTGNTLDFNIYFGGVAVVTSGNGVTYDVM